MVKNFTFLLAILFISHHAFSQSAADVAVQLSAVTQASPAKITLKWKKLPNTNTYSYRKTKSAATWGVIKATVMAPDTTYADLAVATDSAYEYQVRGNGNTITALGYIYAGINNPAIHNKGSLVLLVDSTLKDSCAAGLFRLMQDISGDGWQIIRHDISRSQSVTAIHNLINSDYLSLPDLKAVLILGHVAVPYSGDLNPDGHPNHLGAWPADAYYGNMSGVWTDNLINDTSAGYTANRNIPGDGKWDQTQLPAPSELQVSRVDFYNMTAFNSTEVQMMNRYLQKDHIYKMDSLTVIHRGLVNDNFGYFSGEAFAANAWRNFTPILGTDSIKALPFIATLNTDSYQWAYGCGGGSFTTESGVGATTDFAANNMNAIFTMSFGSYFGDWNVKDNFLRAPLCSNVPALTSCWAGRPNWFLHHMALGEHIGYGALLTQNNVGLYGPAGYGSNDVHIALMGDLTLRTDYIKPARNISITTTAGHGATISWVASPDPAVSGYYVYRSDSMFGHYQKISSSITGTSYSDTAGTNGLKYYMVRATKLQSTPSGTYYNLSIGITDSATVSFPSNVVNIAGMNDIKIFPNPGAGTLNIMMSSSLPLQLDLALVNETGQTVAVAKYAAVVGSSSYHIDTHNLPAGLYTLLISNGKSTAGYKWIKSN